MHLALTIKPFVDADLLYAQQLGVTWMVGDMPTWDYDTLAAACNRVAKSSLQLKALSCLPTNLIIDALLDQPNRARAMDRVCQIITDAGKFGISSLGYNWPFMQPVKVVKTTTGRGGALSKVYPLYDRAQPAQQDSREGMWQVLSDFLKHIMPVAEAAGVRLAYRTDISVASLPEEMRILDSVPELARLFQVAGSSYHGLDLDHGFLTQVLVPQNGLKADEVIRHFGLQKRIFAVRLCNLRCTTHGAQEFFLDEDKVDMLSTLQAYREIGFEGSLCPIPSPDMTDDTEWRHKGYAFSIGYLRGLLQAIRSM